MSSSDFSKAYSRYSDLHEAVWGVRPKDQVLMVELGLDFLNRQIEQYQNLLPSDDKSIGIGYNPTSDL